jgi:hypothetical protein
MARDLCGSCRFFEPTENECRKNPPVVTSTTLDGANGVWPHTRHNYWCGKHADAKNPRGAGAKPLPIWDKLFGEWERTAIKHLPFRSQIHAYDFARKLMLARHLSPPSETQFKTRMKARYGENYWIFDNSLGEA